MTKQLEDLGQKLSIKLIKEGIEDNHFRRYTTLNLNNREVVAACSSVRLTYPFFTDILKNANTIPIGKFLFAPGSIVRRRNDMCLELIAKSQIKPQLLQDILTGLRYRDDQAFWQRTSVFEFQNETLDLIEIILPELDSFF